jgi:tetraacyldisaccharide 4'-kinase
MKDKKTSRMHVAGRGPARLILSPLSLVYGAGVRLRLSLYSAGILKTRRLPCAVISVGNITTGGTGKTPVTMHIAGLLKKRGRRVAILSRGYKRRSKGVCVVSDGKDILLDPLQAGDEPYLMARRLPGVPVVVGEDRVKAGEYLIKRFSPECIVLDDGFQHVRLSRDLNILLVDSKTGLGNDRLLPGGILREPSGGIARADLILVKDTGLKAGTEQRLKGFNLPLLRFHYSVTNAFQLMRKRRLAPDRLKGKKVFALAGVANPQSFLETLEELGVSITGKLLYRDHHSYSKADIDNIKAASVGAELIITTEKDGVKLESFAREKGLVPIYALRIDVTMEETKYFEEYLMRALSGGP